MSLGDLSPGQEAFLDGLDRSPLAEVFYLSGGTALSAFHLHHRRSEDLDLFSREAFSAAAVLHLVNAVADQPPTSSRRIADRFGFLLRVRGEPLKVEFVRYDVDPIEPPAPRRGRLRVDGMRDILANKLSAVVERVEPKDYVDLCFLLRQPGLALSQGLEDCRRKFGWPGLENLLQAAFLRSGRLAELPHTDPPLEMEELRSLFRGYARSLIQLDEG